MRLIAILALLSLSGCAEIASACHGLAPLAPTVLALPHGAMIVGAATTACIANDTLLSLPKPVAIDGSDNPAAGGP